MCPHVAPDGSVLGFPAFDGGRVVAWHLSPGPLLDGSLLVYADIGKTGEVVPADEPQGDRWRRELARAELRRRNTMEAA